MASRSRRLRRAAALAAVLAAAPAAARHPPVVAQVSVTVTTWQNGVPSTSGPHCEPLLDDLPPQCVRPRVIHEGNGADGVVCVPTPV